MLKNVPVKLGMIIAFAVFCFKSKQRPSKQRVFLHGMNETQTASFPIHPLNKIIFGEQGILSAMMVWKKTLVHIDHMVSLSRWTLTIAADFIEIIMPLLAHCRFLSQGTRAIFRPYTTKSHAF